MSGLPDPAETTRNIFKSRTAYGIPPTAFQVSEKNIGEVLANKFRKHSDKPWLIFYSDENERLEYSYRQFHELVCRTANFLQRKGVRRGDRVATVAYNHADTIVQYFAAWMVGAVVVPINVGEDDKRIEFILRNSESKLAFVRDQFLDRILQIADRNPALKTIVRVRGKNPGTLPPGSASLIEFHDAISTERADLPGASGIALDDEALIVYTSGTTGLPKGVVLTQYNLLIDSKAIAEWHGITDTRRMMCVLPIHHVNGIVVTLMAPLVVGSSVVLNQKFHSDRFFRKILDEHVDVVSVVPTLLQFLLHEHAAAPQDLPRSLRHIICGAGPLTVELAVRFEDRFHIPIIHGYGLSETTCYSCFLPTDLSPAAHHRWLNDFGFPSIGVPLPVNEMSIHDDHGQELPEGARGEIVIRGHNVMKAYHANPEANAATFAFGWFRSGDEGFFKTDETGRKFFFITGRIKELIIRGGVNISPFEIDEVLMNMPGVKAGLAVGFENDWYGEEIGAYVQIKEGITLTEPEVLVYCRKYFAFQKCPKVVLFGNDIPVTSTGKYQRNKLRPLFTEWKSVQFTSSKKG
ncbi:MAG TPA: class I adenylate-forming enzyme family protein [Bacteroidota bacterium]|nr:class I adenylate-forming enzyme family protein [Bacteroidota bacterium]